MKNTKQWFEAAVPNPTKKNLNTQVAVHFEEVAEMVEAMTVEGSSAGYALWQRLHLILVEVSTLMKQGEMQIASLDVAEVLDGITDQQVTAIGIGHMLGMDTEGALKEVDRANYSKFSHDGSPIFDVNGKIKKGPRYEKPNLAPFLPTPERIQQVLK